MPVSLLLIHVRPGAAGGENLDEHVFAAETEGRRVIRNARREAFELVSEDRAAGLGRGLNRGDERVDGTAERGHP